MCVTWLLTSKAVEFCISPPILHPQRPSCILVGFGNRNPTNSMGGVLYKMCLSKNTIYSFFNCLSLDSSVILQSSVCHNTVVCMFKKITGIKQAGWVLSSSLWFQYFRTCKFCHTGLNDYFPNLINMWVTDRGGGGYWKSGKRRRKSQC